MSTNIFKVKNKTMFFLKKKTDYVFLDYFLIDAAVVIATLILLKISVPYSFEWIFNTKVWQFICAFLIVIAVLIITNLIKRRQKKTKKRGRIND